MCSPFKAKMRLLDMKMLCKTATTKSHEIELCKSQSICQGRKKNVVQHWRDMLPYRFSSR